MTDRLIIVESPAKANTIKKFLGGNTKVVASMGHIRDLPKSKLGIDIENDFEPEYINIRGKAVLINSLKKDAKAAKKVLLATDPDREGEAIAWHLAYILDIPEESVCRISFNEITKEAVKEAVKKPRAIDINLTDAQQARRVLDRLVGYKISPVLWKKVKRGLSAGRVQSVALKLVCDREEEIEHFVPEEYWTITAIVKEAKTKKTFETKLVGKNKEKLDIHSKEEVDKILKDIENEKFIVEDVTVGEKKRNPAPPFTTSTLQQEASRKLGFAIRKTMMVAQGLYEGISITGHGVTGLITYMRTDSTRISDEARNAAKDVIINNFGEEYYENRYFKVNKESQDAHEAIRPTYLDLSPEVVKNDLTQDQYKLYTLIYNRFIASQMASAVYDTISVDINAGEYNFKTSGQSIKFKGFMTLYVEDTDDEKIDRTTVASYLDAFERMFLLDNLEPFSSNIRSSVRVKQAEKRHFCDPALACVLLKANQDRLLNDLNTFGFLFEALCERDLRIYAESFGGNVFHYQDYRGKEIDTVVELSNGEWSAFEIKLGANQIESAAKNLLAIKAEIEKDPKGRPPKTLCVLCGMSNAAYQRPDGVFVVPITALKN